MLDYRFIFSASCDIDLLAVQACLCSDVAKLKFAPAISDRIRALPVGVPIEPDHLAWCAAGAMGASVLSPAHRKWARAFLDVRLGARCPTLEQASASMRRALARHRSRHVRGWVQATHAVGADVFRISFSSALLVASDAIRAVALSEYGWVDASHRPQPGAWASPEEALAVVGRYYAHASSFGNQAKVRGELLLEALLLANKGDPLWHWPVIAALIGDPETFRMAARHGRAGDALPSLSLTPDDLVELCQDPSPVVREAVVRASAQMPLSAQSNALGATGAGAEAPSTAITEGGATATVVRRR